MNKFFTSEWHFPPTSGSRAANLSPSKACRSCSNHITVIRRQCVGVSRSLRREGNHAPIFAKVFIAKAERKKWMEKLIRKRCKSFIVGENFVPCGGGFNLNGIWEFDTILIAILHINKRIAQTVKSSSTLACSSNQFNLPDGATNGLQITARWHQAGESYAIIFSENFNENFPLKVSRTCSRRGDTI